MGRVQTPTLAIVVERDQKIKNFVPKGYWEVHATFDAKAGTYPGRWFDEKILQERRRERARAVRADLDGGGRRAGWRRSAATSLAS